MPRISRKWNLLLVLALCASLAALGTTVWTPPVQAGLYDSPGTNPGGSGGTGDPTSSGDPDVPTGASKGVRTDVISSTVTLENSGATVVTETRNEWTMRLMIVLYSLRGYLLRF